MKGEVKKPATETEIGLILGENGKQFYYQLSQLRSDDVLVEGQVVDFISLGDEARDIYVPDESTAPQMSGAPGISRTDLAYSSGPAGGSVQPMKNLWTYFTETLTRNYANFQGRARRAEYWGYTLFWWIALILAVILDLVLSFALFGQNEYGEPNIVLVVTILFLLGTAIPNIALWVRRFHDLDLSGWMYLLNFVPYVGGLILFVFSLIDGKPETNKHGPSPKYGADISDVFY